MENIKKELEAFKKATRLEIRDVRKTMDSKFGGLIKAMDGNLQDMREAIDTKFAHMGDTMESGFDRLIVTIDEFKYMEKDLESLEDRVSKIEKRLEKEGKN